MKQLVEYILTNITQKPEAVKVTETVDENGLHLINISVDPEDMGRVIGKSGKVIHAIRNLVRVAAIQKNLRVRVILEDQVTEGETPPPQEAPVEEESTPETKSPEPQEDQPQEKPSKKPAKKPAK